jgi:hypothetical protein
VNRETELLRRITHPSGTINIKVVSFKVHAMPIKKAERIQFFKLIFLNFSERISTQSEDSTNTDIIESFKKHPSSDKNPDENIDSIDRINIYTFDKFSFLNVSFAI